MCWLLCQLLNFFVLWRGYLLIPILLLLYSTYIVYYYISAINNIKFNIIALRYDKIHYKHFQSIYFSYMLYIIPSTIYAVRKILRMCEFGILESVWVSAEGNRQYSMLFITNSCFVLWKADLCNGTRLMVTELRKNWIDAQALLDLRRIPSTYKSPSGFRSFWNVLSRKLGKGSINYVNKQIIVTWNFDYINCTSF